MKKNAVVVSDSRDRRPKIDTNTKTEHEHEIFITDDPKLIAELHVKGEKEIAVRDGREYIFRVNLGASFDTAAVPPTQDDRTEIKGETDA